VSVRRPFYSKFVWKDWVADTVDMTAEEAGVYIRLLAYAATSSPDCASLPDDETRIARAAGVSLKTWRRLSGAVLVKWIRVPTGWQSKRLRADFDHFSQLCEKQRLRRTGGAPDEHRTGTVGAPPRARQIQTQTQITEEPVKTLSPPDGAGRSDFERVWQAYPHYGRRSSKARSWGRWRALRPRPDVESVLTAIDESRDSDDWTKDGGRFVPALEVWIAKRGWDSSDGRADPADEGVGSRANEMLRRARLHRETMGDPDAAL